MMLRPNLQSTVGEKGDTHLIEIVGEPIPNQPFFSLAAVLKNWKPQPLTDVGLRSGAGLVLGFTELDCPGVDQRVADPPTAHRHVHRPGKGGRKFPEKKAEFRFFSCFQLAVHRFGDRFGEGQVPVAWGFAFHVHREAADLTR